MRALRFTSPNNIRLLRCGDAYFPALIQAVDEAKVEIFLETYIFASDQTGQSVQAALKRAAERGVIINLMIDWLGTGPAQVKALKQEMESAGVSFRVFNPWFSRGVARSHRKICVIDTRLAFIGGLNLNDDIRCDFNQEILPAPRLDFAVQISGALIPVIHQEARAQWLRLGKFDIRTRLEIYRQSRMPIPPDPGKPTQAALVVRDNLRNRFTIHRTFLQALGNAHKTALLANPYFAPSNKFRKALSMAAMRGVEVTLILGVGQFKIQDAVAHSFYLKLLKSGVRIVEYRKTQMHGKVAVIDDEWATVGSSNFDGLSLFLNQEANIVVKDAVFAQSLRQHLKQAITEGVEIRLEDYANVPWYTRIGHDLAYLVYKFVMRIITLGKYS